MKKESGLGTPARFEVLHGAASCHCVICGRGKVSTEPAFSILVTMHGQSFFVGDEKKTREVCPHCSARIPLPYLTETGVAAQLEMVALERESEGTRDLDWLDIVPAFAPIPRHPSFVTIDAEFTRINPSVCNN